ncbi:MAG: ABC transporter ATP-binding protein [Thiomargarita sp.]|nr:ABC transporter ATP-binding protein [Thiomargarita sp.]
MSTLPLVFKLQEALKCRVQGGVTFELHLPKLELYQSQFVAIVGDSGCGKSTLLDILALVSQPTTCTQFFYDDTTQKIDIKALWHSKNENALAALRRSQFGYVLQTGGLLPFLTVLQNIQLPSHINGYENDMHIKTLAKRFGIDALLEKKPQYLSGGQRQRVAILRAIAHHPKVILADEPTAAVDKTRALNIVKDFHMLAKERGTTIVMVTHDHSLIAPFADVTYTFEITKRSKNLIQSTCILS